MANWCKKCKQRQLPSDLLHEESASGFEYFVEVDLLLALIEIEGNSRKLRTGKRVYKVLKDNATLTSVFGISNAKLSLKTGLRVRFFT